MISGSCLYCTRVLRAPLSPRKALRGDIKKSIFRHVSGNRGTSRPKVDKSAPMAPRTHLRYPHEGPFVACLRPTSPPFSPSCPLRSRLELRYTNVFARSMPAAAYLCQVFILLEFSCFNRRAQASASPNSRILPVSFLINLSDTHVCAR